MNVFSKGTNFLISETVKTSFCFLVQYYVVVYVDRSEIRKEINSIPKFGRLSVTMLGYYEVLG